MQKYSDTLFNLSYNGSLRIVEQNNTSDMRCYICKEQQVNLFTFELSADIMNLRIHGGDICNTCSQSLANKVARRHDARLRQIQSFMTQRKISILQALSIAIMRRPDATMFESTADAETKKWMSYYETIRDAIQPHLKTLPYYLVVKVIWLHEYGITCVICACRAQECGVIMTFCDYYTKGMFKMCDHCRQMLFSAQTLK